MPFIDSKVTVKMSDSQKEQIKTLYMLNAGMRSNLQVRHQQKFLFHLLSN